MVSTKRIGPCLWFDDQAEDAGHYSMGNAALRRAHDYATST